jgi:hypothetical protein
MKKATLAFVFLLAATVIYAQEKTAEKTTEKTSIGGLFKKASNAIKGTGTSSLTTEEIVSGLKEALSVGAKNSSSKLSAANGFFKDAAVKILMPEEMKKVESKLRSLGMGKLVDDAILSMNRAAEDASQTAAPIFVDAIKKMSVQDAVGILKGADTAATSYLKKTTVTELTTAFTPIVEKSLKKVNATKYWKDLATMYNKFSSTPVNTDINQYVTGKALNGLFFYVAEEEKKIRTNPAARVNDILKKVFGTK